MDVLISRDLEQNERERFCQQVVAEALKMNKAQMNSAGEPCELVAVIIAGENPEEYMVTFALRSCTTGRIVVTLGAKTPSTAISVEEILQTDNGYLDPELFISVVARATLVDTQEIPLGTNTIQ